MENKMKFGWLGLALGAIVILVLTLVLLLAPGPRDNIQETSKLKVLTTFPPIYSFAANVGGDKIALENLLPSGVGPHDYAFSPDDALRLAKADVLFMNGAGVEAWAADLIASAGKTGLKTVELAEGLPRVDGNPHFWLNPIYAQTMVDKIAAALGELDFENSGFYAARAAAYKLKLNSLHEEFLSQLKAVEDQPFVAFHDAFLYFNNLYNLKQVATFEESPGKEPSPRDLADLDQIISRKQVRAIFTEPQFSPKLVQSVAADTGVKVATLDPLETGELAPEFYEQAMRANVSNLLAALE